MSDTQRTLIVGITGRKRSGKDTFASVLVEEHGFTRMAFADALKADLAEMLGVTPAYVEEHKAELRLALQLRGTEYWRARDENHWVDVMHKRAQAQAAVAEVRARVIVPDVRFPNEAAWVRSQGGWLVCVVREYNPHVDDKHISETGQDVIDVDATFTCDGPEEVQERARIFAKGALLC